MNLLLPSVPKGTYFELIPSELIREILLYLEYQDLDVLEVKEDLFWRLKITIDFPDADLDLILQFLSFNRPFNCPFKSKNTRPINITRKRMKDYDLKGPFCSPERAKRTIIITDIPKYLESF